MRDWLIEKEEAYKNAFTDFLEKTLETINKIEAENPEKKINFRVTFRKDLWLSGRSDAAVVDFVTIKELDDDYELTIDKTYHHAKSNTKINLPNKGILNKLMKEGILTNTWFSILDSTRSYDTVILFSAKEAILENNETEFLENRYIHNSFGFNGIDDPTNSVQFKKSHKR